ncbi:MAG: single-stranded DNA-binding protein [Oscillospiraceae bacterium]|nr:single-stranded DNA-binding protein [Oscillospiraceae bacterium]
MLNHVVIMGRLTADPELRQTPNGTSTCRITVAVDRTFVAQGQERQADFITVVAWRQQAEFISRYFSKGRMICIEGNLRTSSYADKRYPDVTHYVTEVYADQVHFTGEKAVQQGQGGYAPAPQQYQYNNQQPKYNSNQQYGGNQQYNPAPAQQPMESSQPISMGDFDDFQIVSGDGDGGNLPF